jgi:hypothetical protein
MSKNLDRLAAVPEREWAGVPNWPSLDDLDDFHLLLTGRWYVFLGTANGVPMAHHEDCQHATMAEGSDVWEPHTNSRMLAEWKAETARRKLGMMKLAWCAHCSYGPTKEK